MNAVSPDDVEEARRWLDGADEELTVAEVLMADSRVPLRAACFHAHLSAEKALKAVVVFRSVPLPRLHSLVRLHRLLPVGDGRAFDVSDLAALNPWTIEGRYPADLEEPGRSESEALVTSARRIITAARSILSSPSEC